MKRSRWTICVVLLVLLSGCTKIGSSDFPNPTPGGGALESWERAALIRVINKIPNTIVRVEFTSDQQFVGLRRVWGPDNKWGKPLGDEEWQTVSPHEVGQYMPYNIYMHGSCVNSWYQDMIISVFDKTGTTCLEKNQVRFRSSAEARQGEVSFASKFGGDYLYDFSFRSWVDNYLISVSPDGSVSSTKWCCFGELVIGEKK